MSAPTRLNLRVPKGLHDTLEQEAKRQGVSLNQLSLALLSGSVGWQATRPEPVDLDLDRLRAFRDAYQERARSAAGRVRGWNLAKDGSHRYAVRERAAAAGLEAEFDHFLDAIRHWGDWRPYGGRDYCKLTVDGEDFWTMRERHEAPAAWHSETTILNRSVEWNDSQMALDGGER